MSEKSDDITPDPLEQTRTLVRRSRTSTGAAEELMGLVYDELRSLARRFMLRESDQHTLQPTALVHEAYLKLLRGAEIEAADRSHFFAIAARAMRRVLVDHAVARDAQKRGGGRKRLTFDSRIDSESIPVHDVLALDEAIESLRGVKERVASVVELRFFAGMTVPETASALEVSERTVADDWAFARAWLARALNSG